MDISEGPSTNPIEIKEVTKTAGKPKLQKLVGLIVLVFLLAGVIFAGYLLTNKSSQNKAARSNNGSKTASNSAKAQTADCGDKQSFVSEKQGYSLCYPTGWSVKQLTTSDIGIGFYKGQVDTSYPGTISVTISDKSENLSVQDVINNSTKYEYAKITAAATRGTQIVYTRTKDDPLANYPLAIDTVIPKFDRTYTISLASNDANYQADQQIYLDFLKSFKFAGKSPALPWSESRNILVYSPWPSDAITSPVGISGLAIAFEGTVNIRIKDYKNHILAQTTIQASSGVERSPFQNSVNFDQPGSNKGTVEVFTISTKDGSEQDKVTVPVNFK